MEKASFDNLAQKGVGCPFCENLRRAKRGKF